MKIDSHQHFWQFAEEDFGWIDETMLSIRRDLLPEDLLAEIRQVGIEGTVAVQARQSIEETEWLLSLAGKDSFIKLAGEYTRWFELFDAFVGKLCPPEGELILGDVATEFYGLSVDQSS